MTHQSSAVLKVRTGVVCFNKHNELLLVRQNNRPFWVLPGGTLEANESIGDCAIREMKEETNLDIRLVKLLTLSDFFPGDDRHVIDVVFLGEILSGQFQLETTENINEAGFFSSTQFASLSVKPESVAHLITQWWSTQHWPEFNAYLGHYSH